MVSRRINRSLAAFLCLVMALSVVLFFGNKKVFADTTYAVDGDGTNNCASFSCTVRASSYSDSDGFEVYSAWAYELNGKADVSYSLSGSTVYVTVKSKDGSPLSGLEIYVGVSASKDYAIDLNRVGIQYYSEDISTPTQPPTEPPTEPPTNTPTSTATPTPKPTATATPTPKVTDTPKPTANTPAPTATPVPTSTPEPTAVPAETEETEVTSTPTPTPTSTPTPTPTETPTPTPTKTPTPTPKPVVEETVAEVIEETTEETEDPDHIPTKPPTKLGAIMGNRDDGNGPTAGSIILGFLKYFIILLAILIVGRLIYLKIKGTYNEDLLKEFIPFKKKKSEDENPETQAVNGFLQKSNTASVRPVYSNAAYEAKTKEADHEKE